MKIGKLARLDIDALWNALQPRILGISSGGTGRGVPGPAGATGPKGVTWRGAWAADTDYEKGDIVTSDSSGGETLTFFCIDANTSLAGSPPTVGGDTRWHEISPGYLIVDGSRAMTGDIYHGGFSILDAHDADIEGTATVGEDVVMTGGVTSGAVKDASRIDFNTAVVPGTDYTALAGRVSWADMDWLGQLIQHVAHDAGVVRITTTGVFLRGVAPVAGLAELAPVVIAPTIAGNPMNVTPLIPGMAINEQGVPGLTTHAAASGASVWVCCAGQVDGVDTSAYTAGNALWLDPETGTLLASIPTKGYDPAFIRMGYVIRVGASGSVWVCPDWRPQLNDISNVIITASGEPAVLPRFDILQYLPQEDDPGEFTAKVWRNHALNRFPARDITGVSDYLITDHDVMLNVECTDSDVTLTLPHVEVAYDGLAMRYTIRRNGSGAGKVIIDKWADPLELTNLDDGPWSLLKHGEVLTLQLTDSLYWMVI